AVSRHPPPRLGMEAQSIGQAFEAQLDDRSQARFERTRLLRLELLDRLNKAPDIPGDSTLARHLDIIRQQYEALTRLEAYGFGRYEPGMARPYAVDQLSGAWVDVPDLLISSHPLGSFDDADDYLVRLDALGGAVADEKRRLVSEAATGILPPDFVLTRLEQRLREFANQPLDTHPLVTRLDAVIGGLPADETHSAAAYRASVRRVMRQRVIPAYAEFADTVAELALEASSSPGLNVPSADGSNASVGSLYYADVLAFYTAPDTDPDFLHRQGLGAVADIKAEIQDAFASIGLEGASPPELLELLAASPSESHAPTAPADPEAEISPEDEARARVLARLEEKAADARRVLPGLLQAPPQASLVVTRMPSYKETAFKGASYVAATANGSSPALVQVNLSDLNEWPEFTLATLIHHEGIPGHHVESASASETARLPLLRQMIWDTAYGEGWAVYGEDLADTAGLYADDPLGRIGYLQSLLFRAARLVVDTGIHAKGWSYEEAVDYLTDTTGFPRAAMAEEVARYAVWPGQASAYFYGRHRILDMRTRAEAVLTGSFDERGFNSAVLTGGPRPLSMVEQDIEAWYADRLER
ncbi:MAG: DUF885 domain-containing protein, partial [Henriciella sp.]